MVSMQGDEMATGGKGFHFSHFLELHHTRSKHGHTSLKYRMLKVIHSREFQVFFGVLLLVDILCLIGELLVDTQYPACVVIERSCEASNSSIGFVENGECFPFCIDPPAAAKTAKDVFFFTSITILVLFEIELLLIALTIRWMFFHNLFYMVDFIVVTVALVLELVLRGTAEGEAAGLLIVTRAWRLVRIGHGIFADTHEYDLYRLEDMEKRIAELQARVAKASSRNLAALS